MVQRLGRTGRQSKGKVIILVAEGKEKAKKEKYERDSKVISKKLKQVSSARKL